MTATLFCAAALALALAVSDSLTVVADPGTNLARSRTGPGLVGGGGYQSAGKEGGRAGNRRGPRREKRQGSRIAHHSEDVARDDGGGLALGGLR